MRQGLANRLRRLARDRRGTTNVEYIVILVLVVVVCVGAFKMISLMVTRKAETAGAAVTGQTAAQAAQEGAKPGATGTPSATATGAVAAHNEFDPDGTHMGGANAPTQSKNSMVPRILLVVIGVMVAGAMVVGMYRAKRGASQ